MSSLRRILTSLLIVLSLSGAVLAFVTFQGKYVGFNPIDLTEGRDYVWLTKPDQLSVLAKFPWATTLFEKELASLSIWGEPDKLSAAAFSEKLISMLGQDYGVVWVEGEIPLFLIPYESNAQAKAALAHLSQAFNLPVADMVSVDPWTMGVTQSMLVLAPTESDINALKDRTMARHGLMRDKSLRLRSFGVAVRFEEGAEGKYEFALEGLALMPSHKANPATRLTQLSGLDPLMALYSSDINSWLKDISIKFPSLEESFSKLGLDLKDDFTVYLKKNFAFVLLPATHNAQEFPGIAMVSEVSGATRGSLETSLGKWKEELQNQVSSFPAITSVTLPDGTVSRELSNLKQAHYSFDQVDHKDFTVTRLIVPSATKDTLPVLGLSFTLWKNYLIVANDDTLIPQVQSALAKSSLPGRGLRPHFFEASNFNKSYRLTAKYFELLGSELPDSLRTSEIQSLELSFFGGSKDPSGILTLSSQ